MPNPSVLDAPAELRLIVRKYAQYTQVPAGEDRSQALSEYNTAKLQDGAVAMVTHVGGAGPTQGRRSFYVFRRDESAVWFAPTTERIMPRSGGGGVWYQYADGGWDGTLLSVDTAGPTTVTAGGGDTVVSNPGSVNLTFDSDYGLLGRARVKVDGGAVAGAVVIAKLEYSTVLPEVWGGWDVSAPLTLLANQQVEIGLIGYDRTVLNYLAVRVSVSCTAQDVTVPVGGVKATIDRFRFSSWP
jgi:hypothetical protein